MPVSPKGVQSHCCRACLGVLVIRLGRRLRLTLQSTLFFLAARRATVAQPRTLEFFSDFKQELSSKAGGELRCTRRQRETINPIAAKLRSCMVQVLNVFGSCSCPTPPIPTGKRSAPPHSSPARHSPG